MQALKLTREDPSKTPILSLETVPKPEPKAGFLLIKVHASAIHPSDLLNASGSFALTAFPRIPGRDFSGVVEAGPENLVGTAVFGTSGYTQAFSVDGAQAEYILVPEHAVVPKPESLNWVQAATVGVPFSTAALILRRGGVQAGESVLVLGANGAVGSAVVQLAKARGAKVFQGTRNDKGDVNTSSDPELSALDTLTEGKGVDVVVDTVGSPSLTAAAVKKLARGGRVVFIAAPRTGSTDLGVEMVDFYRREKSVLGVNSLLYSVEEMAERLGELGEGFEKGSLQAAEDGWNEVPLENAVEAYKKGAQRGGGKFVVVMA